MTTQGSDVWRVEEKNGVFKDDWYRFKMSLEGGEEILRRDPYARQTAGGTSKWCVLTDLGREFEWTDWAPRPFDEYMIYELHVGSFTPEGTIEAATHKLEHIAGLGFTAVELMPMAEFSTAMEGWGYNPRQLLAL